MPKISYTQEELNTLFGEDVVLVDGSVRRVTKADVLQKNGLPSNFDIVIVEADEDEEESIVTY